MKRQYKGRNKRARKERAEGRIELRKNRSPKDQLNLLDRRLGRGIGATRERTKLIKELHTG